ncbi:hypothetical protein TCSYLVIO_008808, partial [Trypanosoma cruzi]
MLVVTLLHGTCTHTHAAPASLPFVSALSRSGHTHGQQQQQHKSARNNTAHTTRSRTVTIVTIARSGVTGVSELIREAEGKGMEQEGEGRSAADTARVQQDQPHSSHTTRRHPRKEGTQRQQPPTMQEEKTSTTISPSSSHSQREMAKARGHHTTHTERAPTTPVTRASGPSSIHHAAKKFQPSRHQWDAAPNSTQSHAVHRTRRKGDAGCALPLLPSPHGNEE